MASGNEDSRRFFVSGLRFGREKARQQLAKHFGQFGELTIKLIDDCQPNTSAQCGGLIKVEEPLYRGAAEEYCNRGYAILTFAADESANNCANHTDVHRLEGGYDVKCQRMTDLTKGSINHRVPTTGILVSFMAVRGISELALKTTFLDFGEIKKIEFLGRSDNNIDYDCAFIDFIDPLSVERVIGQNHCVGGHRVKIRRVLRAEDIKKLAQKDRERVHREEWMKRNDPSGNRREPVPSYLYTPSPQHQQQYSTHGYYAQTVQPVHPSSMAGYAQPGADASYGYGGYAAYGYASGQQIQMHPPQQQQHQLQMNPQQQQQYQMQQQMLPQQQFVYPPPAVSLQMQQPPPPPLRHPYGDMMNTKGEGDTVVQPTDTLAEAKGTVTGTNDEKLEMPMVEKNGEQYGYV